MAKTTTNLKDTSSVRGHDADVSALVDAVLADPSRAEDAKALLTQKLYAPKVSRIAVPNTSSKTRFAAEEAEDDMWDNLPV